MECSRCEEVVYVEGADLPTETTQIEPGIEGIPCPTCGLCTVINYGGVWTTITECLKDATQKDGWSPVEGLRDKAIHWILAQIVYRFCEPPNPANKEVIFDTPDPTDDVLLLWIGGVAVGFCSLKPRGAVMERTYERYAMLTVDTIFVRSSHRRRGHVGMLLKSLAESHTDVGFSQPISDIMSKVLMKFLTNHVNYRRSFWEISGAGTDGCRKLLWYTLRKTQNIKKKLF